MSNFYSKMGEESQIYKQTTKYIKMQENTIKDKQVEKDKEI